MYLMLACPNDGPDEVEIYNTDSAPDRDCIFADLTEFYTNAKIDRINEHEWYCHHVMKLEPVWFKLSRVGEVVASVEIYDKYDFMLISIPNPMGLYHK